MKKSVKFQDHKCEKNCPLCNEYIPKEQKELFRLAKKHHCLLDLLWRNGFVWNGCWWGMGKEFRVRAKTYDQMIKKLYNKIRGDYE